MKKSAGWIVGKMIALACVIGTVYFIYSIAATLFVPAKYLVALSVMLVLLVICIALLTWSTKNKACYGIGVILAVILLAVEIIGGVYISKMTSTMKKITTVSTETSVIGIFVRAEDPNDFNTVAADYTYGILAELDRENTDKAIEQFSQEYGLTLRTVEYDGLPALIDALLRSEADAIILNVAYLDVLEEMDGYEDIMSRIRQVTFQPVEKIIVIEKDAQAGIADTPTVEYQEDGSTSAFTLFISGIDTRGGMTSKSRSDVNILATVNTDTQQVLLVSTPRDFYVPLSISNGSKDKLTHAGIYGIDVCMDTIGMLYDVDVDYYFRVNFTGFVDIIDALGGITVNSDFSFTAGQYSFSAGPNTVDGTAALAFARERYAFADGDRQRGKNQMAVIKGVINKMLSTDMLVHYVSVLEALENSFETSVPFAMISRLVRAQVANGGDWNIVTYSVNGFDDSQIPYSMNLYAYVMVPDETTVSTAKELIQSVLAGEIITAP